MSHPNTDLSSLEHLDPDSSKIIDEVAEAQERAERTHKTRQDSGPTPENSRDHRGPLNISTREHMTEVDVVDGKRVRAGEPVEDSRSTEAEDIQEILPTITPVADGRLKNVRST